MLDNSRSPVRVWRCPAPARFILLAALSAIGCASSSNATGGGAGTALTLAGRTFIVKKIPYEVWLDEHGRIHRIVEVFTFSKVAGSTAPKDQVVVTSGSAFSGYGTPVTVTLPAAKDVYGAQSAK